MRLSFEILLFVTLVVINNGQEIAFPAVEEQSPGEVPPRLTDNRIPIYIPNRCPPNQLLYPGDQKHDWVCDCGPGYIFYPKKDGCFLAYRKGPCDENQYLILPKDKVVPECSDNPCKTDGYVRYEDECYKLDSTGKPCKPYYESGEFFGVNTTTLKLECMTKAPDMLSQEPKYVPCKFRSLRYEDECYKLDSTGKPCKPYHEGGGIFGINTTTLNIECLQDATVKLSLAPHHIGCPLGSIRALNKFRKPK